MKYRPLMMMRTRGLMGPIACKYANLKTHVAKSVGNAFAAGGPKDPVNLLVAADDLNDLAWEKLGLGITDLGNGEFRITNTAGTNSALSQRAPAELGKTYRLSAELRMKSHEGEDYRLAIGEYQGTTWLAATPLGVWNSMVINDPTWQYFQIDRTFIEPTVDVARWALQLVNTPAGSSIELRNPKLIQL